MPAESFCDKPLAPRGMFPDIAAACEDAALTPLHTPPPRHYLGSLVLSLAAVRRLMAGQTMGLTVGERLSIRHLIDTDEFTVQHITLYPDGDIELDCENDENVRVSLRIRGEDLEVRV